LPSKARQGPKSNCNCGRNVEVDG
jgi:hypothetical protein